MLAFALFGTKLHSATTTTEVTKDVGYSDTPWPYILNKLKGEKETLLLQEM